MREPSHTVGERGYVRRPPPSATWAVRGRGGAGGPRLSLYIPGGAPAVFRNTVLHICAKVRRAARRGKKAAGALARAALLCSHAALRARGDAGFACACLAALTRTCWLSRSRARAAVRGSVLSVVPLIVQCGAMWCCCGLCSACRACAVVKPWFHGLLPVRAR